MINNKELSITKHQYIHILIGSMVGSGILSLPRITAKIVGQDAWFAVILGAILPVISIMLIHLLCSKYPEIDFVDLSQHIAGRFFGKIIILPFIIYSTIASGIISRIFIEAIRLSLLNRTPILLLVILILLAAAYLAASDIRILGRVNEFLFYVLPISMSFILPFVLYNADILQLLPVLNHSYKEYIKATFNTSFAYSGFEISLLAYAYVDKKEKILKAGITSILITVFIYLYTVVNVLLIFGPELTQKFTFPTIKVLTTYEIPILERIEFVFLILWITMAFKPICNQYFFSVHLIKKFFNMKSNKTLVIIMFPIITAIATFPVNTLKAFKLSDYVGWMALFVGIVVPLILLAISLLHTRGGKMHETK